MSSSTHVEPAQRVDAQNPWPGLEAFDEDAALFFNGREAESAELVRLIGQAPLTVLFGRSGLGKTSLLRAGVFPLLRARGVFPVYVRLAVQEREGELIEQLGAALFRESREHGAEVAPRSFKGSLWERLHLRDFALWSRANRPLTPLFVIDQFEEVFTLGAANRRAIERLRIDLADLIENRIPAHVVRKLEDAPEAMPALDTSRQAYKLLLSFREDFLPETEAWRREIPSLTRNRLRLTAMNAEQAFQAVHKTGAAARLVDERTAREIVRFVGGMQGEDTRGAGSRRSARTTAANAAPPADEDAFAHHEIEPALLSLVCAELNRRRQGAASPKPGIDVDLLRDTGASIIRDFYLRQVGKVPAATRRFIEEDLLTEGGYRNSFPVDEALKRGALTDDTLRRLVDGRVLRVEQQLGVPRVELTHDRLTDVVRHERERRRERERGARRRQQLQWMAAGGAAAFVLVLVASFTFVAQLASERQRDEAERQRTIAVKALADERRQRDEAERQRRLAEAARASAEAARQAAEELRREAEEALRRVEEEKARAEQQRQLAETRQRQVEQEQEKVRVASQRADVAADKARRQEQVLGELYAPVRPGVLRIEFGRGGIATGFFITRSGLAVTPAHVVGEQAEQRARVVHFDGRAFEARLVRLERQHDLALLHVAAAAPTPCLRFVDQLIKPGTPVVALSISSPRDWVATTGTVLRLDVTLGVFPGRDLIEVDMKAGGGFSGAPVMDPYARRVVGIGAYGRPDREQSRHYLIPASRIRQVFARELGRDGCPAE